MSMDIIGKIFKDVGFAQCTVKGDGLKHSRDCVTGRAPKETQVVTVV